MLVHMHFCPYSRNVKVLAPKVLVVSFKISLYAVILFAKTIARHKKLQAFCFNNGKRELSFLQIV
jgi:hypothetical protein